MSFFLYTYYFKVFVVSALAEPWLGKVRVEPGTVHFRQVVYVGKFVGLASGQDYFNWYAFRFATSRKGNRKTVAISKAWRSPVIILQESWKALE